MAKTKLTVKQERFISEYLVDNNASKACLRAGYKTTVPHVMGYELMQNPKVREAVDAQLAKRKTETRITASRVLQEIECMAFFDPADMLDTVVKKPEDIKDLPEHVRRNIAGWSWDKYGNFVLKFNPKTTALDQLNRHLGLYRDTVNVNASVAATVTAGAVVLNTTDPVEAARAYSDMMGKS